MSNIQASLFQLSGWLEFLLNDAIISIFGGITFIRPNQVLAGAKEYPQVLLVIEGHRGFSREGLAAGSEQLDFLPEGIVVVIVELPQCTFGVTCIDQIKIAVVVRIHRNRGGQGVVNVRTTTAILI